MNDLLRASSCFLGIHKNTVTVTDTLITGRSAPEYDYSQIPAEAKIRHVVEHNYIVDLEHVTEYCLDCGAEIHSYYDRTYGKYRVVHYQAEVDGVWQVLSPLVK